MTDALFECPIHAQVMRGPGNPVLTQTPQESARALLGKLPRPHYAPQPVGPSHDEILHAKSQVVWHRQGVSRFKSERANIEAQLDRFDAQMVIASTVPGYTDPPARVARAEADKAAGIKSVLTPEDGLKIMRGEMARPRHPGVFFHQIFDLKQRSVHYSIVIEHTEGHNEYLEYDLDQLDPQRVCEAHVAAYKDPPVRLAKAAAAKAAGTVPDESVGV